MYTICRIILSLFVLSAFQLAAGDAKPNILFLFSDDQRPDTIAALGNTHISTPNMDALVNDGTVFTRAYCMGAMQGAVCVPSRAMLMTGRTLFRVQTTIKNQATWPDAFAKTGYRTFMTGKWHNGDASVLAAFQEGKTLFLGGMTDPYKATVQDIGGAHTLVNKRVSEKHVIAAFADSAIEFLAEQKGERPFLCYVAFNAPHDPRTAPKEFHDKYNAAKPPLPANFLPLHPFNSGNLTGRDEELATWPRTPEIVQQHLADYYASIEHLDMQIGRILEALKKSGQYEKTIIVFSSDHGLAIGSHGLFGKQNLYDHSMHAPLIFCGPGIPKKTQRDALVYLLDIFPTLGAMAGVSAPEGSEGDNLQPVISGTAPRVREAIETAYTSIQRAVRDERWKLIAYTKINKVQLFDLQNDPAEMNDLAGDAQFTAEKERMLGLLKKLQKQNGDSQALTSATPDSLEFDFSKVKSGKKSGDH